MVNTYRKQIPTGGYASNEFSATTLVEKIRSEPVNRRNQGTAYRQKIGGGEFLCAFMFYNFKQIKAFRKGDSFGRCEVGSFRLR